MKVIPVFLKEYKSVVITLILVAIIADIFLIRLKSDLIAFAILSLVVFFFKFYKLRSKKIFILCLIPTGIIFLAFLIDSQSLVIEKAAIWLFLLMGTGIVWEFLKRDTK